MVAACVSSTAGTPDLATSDVSVGDSTLRVWVADDSIERQQGLRGVEELPGEVEGMLFVFPEPVNPTFVMLDAMIPLDVWFFDAQGALIGSAEMAPCPEEPCARYQAPGQVQWALETPLGEYDFAPGDVLATSASG